VPSENGMTEDKLACAIDRSRKAAELLENELLQEAFAKLEANYIEAWRNSRPMDEKAREKLWQAINIVGLVRDHLTRLVNGGKLAQKELRMRTAQRPE
jgi:hypothetical protein